MKKENRQRQKLQKLDKFLVVLILNLSSSHCVKSQRLPIIIIFFVKFSPTLPPAQPFLQNRYYEIYHNFIIHLFSPPLARRTKLKAHIIKIPVRRGENVLRMLSVLLTLLLPIRYNFFSTHFTATLE